MSASRAIQIPAGAIRLEANLTTPPNAKGMVVFAHGSGSSRHSSRNRYVAEQLQNAGLGTLLMDLLTSTEEVLDQRTAQFRFDIHLLGFRLVNAIDWLIVQPGLRRLPIGCFGASTGAAAALIAAAERPDAMQAVVSRGGRPDLALKALAKVQAPTLLIVGAMDVPVIGMNKDAMSHLRCETRLEIIAEATHLFEEPGALDEVARLASQWFCDHLKPPSA